jgi:hypothetical protein
MDPDTDPDPTSDSTSFFIDKTVKDAKKYYFSYLFLNNLPTGTSASALALAEILC